MSGTTELGTLREVCQKEITEARRTGLKARAAMAVGTLGTLLGMAQEVFFETAEWVELPPFSMSSSDLAITLGCTAVFLGTRSLWRANDSRSELAWIQDIAEQHGVADILCPLPVTYDTLDRLTAFMPGGSRAQPNPPGTT